jgi:hypothetical protein
MQNSKKISIAIQELQKVNSDNADVNASIATALDCLVFCKNATRSEEKGKPPMATKRRIKIKASAPSLFDC